MYISFETRSTTQGYLPPNAHVTYNSTIFDINKHQIKRHKRCNKTHSAITAKNNTMTDE